MDRNLGALDDRYHASAENKSKYYQFGRKDPFNASISCWSYEPETFTPSTTSAGALVRITKEVLDDLSGQYKTDGRNVPFSVNHPNHFIYKTPYTWTSGDIFNSSKSVIWYDPSINIRIENEEDSAKSIFDPCPLGWILPVKGWAGGFRGDANESATGDITLNCQWNVETDTYGKHRGEGRTYFPLGYLNEKNNRSAQSIFFPSGGSISRESGSYSNGARSYWNSTRESETAGGVLSINGYAVREAYFHYDENRQAYGYPVRCLKE